MARMHRWALELFRRGGTGWIEGDTGAMLEGEGEVRKGDTGVFVDCEEQRIEMCLGDSAPYHAGHVEMRIDFYTEGSRREKRKEERAREEKKQGGR